MIVTRTTEGFRIVTQADHARLAAEILRLARLPELTEHPRRELLLRAVAEHDNGWWEADAAPRLDTTGTAPEDFRVASAPLRQEIWRRGVERFSAAAPYLAALVATHALRILRPDPLDPLDPEWSAFLAGLASRREELLGAAGEALASAQSDDRWLELADGLALAAATGEAAFVSRAGWRAEVASLSETAGTPSGEPAVETVELALAPFPFAGATSFGLSCRILPPRSFSSGSELAVALAGASFRRLRVRLRPLALPLVPPEAWPVA
jgi:hypothetical protein